MSVRLDSVEEQLQSGCRGKPTGGLTTEELEKERTQLRKRRDALDAQLKDNRVLSVEVRGQRFQLFLSFFAVFS